MKKEFNKICCGFLLVVALYLGFVFFFITAGAEGTSSDEDYMPTAGWERFIEEIPVAPVEEIEYEVEPETLLQSIEPRYILTDDEARMLMQIGVLEAGEKDIGGIANVMQVILNRVESDRFPNTIEGVIFQKNPVQFVTAEQLATANITPEAYAALDQVIFGDYTDNDAHFFESCEGLAFASWADYTFSYGGHDFYRAKEVCG